AVGLEAAVGVGLLAVPGEEHLPPGDGVHGDTVLVPADGRYEAVVPGVGMDVHPHSRGDVAAHAVAPHGRGQTLPVAARPRGVTLQAGALRGGVSLLVRLVGVVAGRAGEGIALLEAPALPEVLHLVGDVVVLGVFVPRGAKIRRQRLAGPVAERRAAGLVG